METCCFYTIHCTYFHITMYILQCFILFINQVDTIKDSDTYGYDGLCKSVNVVSLGIVRPQGIFRKREVNDLYKRKTSPLLITKGLPTKGKNNF